MSDPIWVVYPSLILKETPMTQNKNIQKVLYIQPEHQTKPSNGEPDSVRYFAVGVLQNGLFSGIIHGYEGGGSYSEHYMLEGKYIPYAEVENEAFETIMNQIMWESFIKECYERLEEYVEYSNNGYFYEIKDRDKFNKFTPVYFPKPDYANTVFGNKEKYWSDEDFLKKCDIKEVAKKIVQNTKISQVSHSSIIKGTMEKLKQDNIYGPFFTEEVEKLLTEYLNKIFAEIEERSINLDEIAFRECDICTSCNKVLLPDDELYTSHEGESLCDACSIRCEGCEKYFTSIEIVIEDGFFVCRQCATDATE